MNDNKVQEDLAHAYMGSLVVGCQYSPDQLKYHKPNPLSEVL